MADPTNIEAARALLKEGKVQEADDLLKTLSADATAAAEAAAGKPAEPPPPRAPELIIFDLFFEIIAHLGNKPLLEQLLEDLKAAGQTWLKK